jgi:hypothetical protein
MDKNYHVKITWVKITSGIDVDFLTVKCYYVYVINQRRKKIMKLKRIWNKKEVEGCTEEQHRQVTKDGKYSVGIELNYCFAPFSYDRRQFEWGKYSVIICDKNEDKEVHRITKFLHTSQDGLDLIREAKLWVQGQFYP